MNEKPCTDAAVEGLPSNSGDSSIAPDVPRIPAEAVAFSKAVGELAARHGIEKVSMEIEVDTGYGTKYRDFPIGTIVEKMRVNVSLKDGRGRPRTQIYVQADIHVSEKVVWEPNSCN